MSTRQQITLNGKWAFWPDPDNRFSLEDLPTRAANKITVPGPWQAEEAFRQYTGNAWYRRTFELPEFHENAVFLCFGAVDYLTEAWINGQPAGTHEGGYLPFEFEVTSFVRKGKNTLIAQVSDPLELFAEIPHGKQSWYGMMSGIWQSAWVEVRPAAFIQHMKLTPHDQQVDVAIDIGYAQTTSSEGFAGLALRAVIRSPYGAKEFDDIIFPDLLVDHETGSLQFNCPLPNPLLWDIDSPNLYTLEASLVDTSGNVIDTFADQFGFRTITTRNGQILLNGRPLYLRAALDQDYYPDGFGTLPSEEFIFEEFRKAREMGLNCLRIHIKIADPRYYAAADRIGLLVWTELPNWVLLSEAARQRARDTLLGMVERDWNHPSIVIWTIINESWGIDLTNPEQRKWLRKMYTELKTADPNRLVVDNSACWGNFHVATDLDDFHNYYAMPDHYDRWRAWVTNFASRPWWTFAHDYTNASAWSEFLHDPWNTPARPHSKEVSRKGDEPLLVSEFGNWGLPDVKKLFKAYGGEPWWFETGAAFGDGVVYPHGVQQRFLEYHLQRAFGDLTGLALQSQRHQFAALKYQIEQIRMHQSIQGYVITEFTDVLWESNGLLDMQRQPKAHYDALGWLNNDNMIIPDIECFAFNSKDKINIPLSLSHYSTESVDVQSKPGQIPALVEWWVKYPYAKDLPTTIEGTIRGLSGPTGSVVSFGEISFEAPEVDHPTHLKLELHWRDDFGRLMARNEVDLYIFPAGMSESAGTNQNDPVYLSDNVHRPSLTKSLAKAGFRVAEKPVRSGLILANTMTDDLRQRLQDGARVLWLVKSSKDMQTSLGGVNLAARRGSPWQGDWASSMNWICRDRIFLDLPVEGSPGFIMKDLTPEHVLTGFSAREFGREVQAGLFVGWVHKPAATIAERRIGQGHLMACTYRLAENVGENPVADYMLKELVRSLMEPDL